MIKSCPYFHRVTRETLQKTGLSFFFFLYSSFPADKKHAPLFIQTFTGDVSGKADTSPVSEVFFRL